MTTNPLRSCGLAPQFLQELAKCGGTAAVRQAVRDQKRSASKVLHPDVNDGKQRAYYVKLLASADIVGKLSDTELKELLAKLKRPIEPDPMMPVTSLVPSGRFLRSMVKMCSSGHLPSAREVSFYPMMPPGTKPVASNAKEAENKRPPLSVIRPTKTGIEYRQTDADEWLQEEGLFFAGSFDRKIDSLLRSSLEWEYRNNSPLLLPGRVFGGRTTFRTMAIPSRVIASAESFYTPEVIDSNALALVDATGNLLYAGHVYERR